jgi:type I restriction enzyme S subunit
MPKNENRPGYKKAKVGWIPEGWEETSLRNICELQSGKFITASAISEKEQKSSFPCFGGNGLRGYVDSYSHDGDYPLIGRQGALCGNISWASGKFYATEHAVVVTPIKNTASMWLYYKLDHLNLNKYATGVAQPGLSVHVLNQVMTPTPPLAEQEAIAGVLECWDRGIRALEKKIGGKRLLKKGLMQKLLSGNTRLPGFHGRWKTVRLGTLGKLSKGAGISKEELSENGLPCIRYGEIYTVHHFVLKEFRSFISPAIAAQSVKIKRNDLLFAGSGETAEEIGKSVAYMDEAEAYAGGDVILLSVHPEKGLADYLSYYLNSVGRKALNRLGQGQSVVHIYPKNLSCLEIPIPLLDEQRAIAAVLSAADGEIEVLERKLALWKEQKMFLLNNLVTGTIRLPEFRERLP